VIEFRYENNSGHGEEVLVKQNMGRWDRVLRLAAAAVIAVLLILGVLKGTAAVVLAIVAAVFVITTFVGFCPLYVPLGISTKGKGGAPRVDV
jgi:fatty acid desaturase